MSAIRTHDQARIEMANRSGGRLDVDAARVTLGPPNRPYGGVIEELDTGLKGSVDQEAVEHGPPRTEGFTHALNRRDPAGEHNGPEVESQHRDSVATP